MDNDQFNGLGELFENDHETTTVSTKIQSSNVKGIKPKRLLFVNDEFRRSDKQSIIRRLDTDSSYLYWNFFPYSITMQQHLPLANNLTQTTLKRKPLRSKVQKTDIMIV